VHTVDIVLLASKVLAYVKCAMDECAARRGICVLQVAASGHHEALRGLHRRPVYSCNAKIGVLAEK
jgi:hypothetical protein